MSNFAINANSIYDRVIRIGRQTENLVSSITFNLNMWIEEYGQGECVLSVKRNGDVNAYLVPMTIADGMTTWTITDTDTARKGRGEIQLKYTTGEKVKTSPIFTISCGESLVGDGEVPEPYEEWLTELNRMTAEVEAAKTSAYQSAQTAQTAAETASAKATEAEQSANTASGFAVNASASATSASTSAQAASVARTAAEAAAISAQAEAEDAEAAKTATQTASESAQASAQNASDKAAQAAESAANAQESVTDAQSEVAKAKAEADRAKTYADRAAEVELEIPTKVSQLENDAGYLTEHQSLADYVRKDVLYNMLPVDTASGPIASFPDGADDIPLKSLVVGITGTQDGSENPSPTNVRPITGWTGMTLNANGTEIPISWETEAGTVYTGSLDVLTGLLTVTHRLIDLGSLAWSTSASSGRHTAPCPSDFIIVANNVLMSAICSNYRTLIGNNVSLNDMSIGMINLGSLLVNDSNLSHATPADFTAAMAGVQLAYEIAEPVTYQLTPHEVKSLLGSNTIYADTGDTTVEYRADIQKWVEKKLSTRSTVSLTRSMPVQTEDTEPTLLE